MTIPAPQYKPLALAQVCEIRDEVEAVYGMLGFVTIGLFVQKYSGLGFDPADVRQVAEEALENLRAE